METQGLPNKTYFGCIFNVFLASTMDVLKTFFILYFILYFIRFWEQIIFRKRTCACLVKNCIFRAFFLHYGYKTQIWKYKDISKATRILKCFFEILFRRLMSKYPLVSSVDLKKMFPWLQFSIASNHSKTEIGLDSKFGRT